MVLLELAVSLAHEAVADRVPVQRPFGVATHVAQAVAMPLWHRAGEHGSVVREDPAALDLLLLEQRALVGFLVLQCLRVEDRPPGREADQDREEDDDQAEELDDLAVHRLTDHPRGQSPRGQ